MSTPARPRRWNPGWTLSIHTFTACPSGWTWKSRCPAADRPMQAISLRPVQDMPTGTFQSVSHSDSPSSGRLSSLGATASGRRKAR